MKDSKLLHIPFRELFSDGSFLYFIVSAVCTLIAYLSCCLPALETSLAGKYQLCVDVMLVIHGKLLTRLRSGLSVRCY